MKKRKYSISVKGPTYDRLRSVVMATSVQKFVDGLVIETLDDPAAAARLAARCRAA